MQKIDTRTHPPGEVQAEFHGGASGQIIVGNHNLQIGSLHGGQVNLVHHHQRPRRASRPAPVHILPREFEGLIDRKEEVSRAEETLSAGQPMDVHARSGMGKTSLLRFLSHHSLTAAFPDGVVYLRVARQPLEDLGQSIFDAFYEFNAPYKPSQGEIRQGIQEKRALVVLDDVSLEREEVESLMDLAPGCTFLLASAGRKLWGQGDYIALSGLPAEDALALFERELGRSLEPDERPRLRELCARLRGHPLSILQAASLVRERGLSLSEIASDQRAKSSQQALVEQILGSLDQAEKRVVAAVAALDGAPLHRRHLPSLTGLEDPKAVVDALLRRGILQAHSPKYTLAGDLGATLDRVWDLDAWREASLGYFQHWSLSRRQDPSQLAEESEALVQLIEWAAGKGRWASVLRLAYHLEGALALAARWSSWAWVLDRGLEAAQALGDQRARAWALHQLGTRALCLGLTGLARGYLIRALRLRQALGDWQGAAVTRHNLNLILGSPSGPSNDGPKGPPDPPSTSLGGAGGAPASKLALFAVVVVVFLAAGLLLPPLISSAFSGTPAAIVAPITQTPQDLLPDTGSIHTGDSRPAVTGTPTASATSTMIPSTGLDSASTSTLTQTTGPSSTPTASATVTPAGTASSTPSRTPTASATMTASVTMTPSTTVTPTSTPSWTPSITPTSSATVTPSTTVTPSVTITPTGTPSPTTPVPAEPADLISILRVDAPTSTGSSIRVPFVLELINQGGSAAGRFNSDVLVRLADTRRPLETVRFTTKAPLDAGTGLTFTSAFELDSSWAGKEVELWAIADSCPSSERLSECNVPESDESNNAYGPVWVKLPAPANEPPEPFILFPGSGDVFDPTGKDESGYYAEIDLYGEASDPEDGQLLAESLLWTTIWTNEAGQRIEQNLGSGSELVVRLRASRGCQATAHTITLTAEDSGGKRSRDQVEVTLTSVC